MNILAFPGQGSQKIGMGKLFYENFSEAKRVFEEVDDTLKFKLSKLIFDGEFRNFITSQTGFKYSIDYFGAYQNSHIPKKHIDIPWYANHYHLDKPNSANMLKVFIPLTKIGINDGPLELIDINQRKQYLVGDLGDIFLCKLNVCPHKAGVPKDGNKTNLIMIQLNPSRKWYLNENLYQRQFKKEPKFTGLTNKFVRRVRLN